MAQNLYEFIKCVVMDQGAARDFEKRLDGKLKGNIQEMMDFICRELPKVNSNYNWTGIYVLKKNKLKLAAFQGKETEHVEIILGDGLCSQAITQDGVVNEPDVKSNGKYLACFPETSSEIVVPIRHKGIPIGEIDIDSDRKNAFSIEDEEFLSKICDKIAHRIRELHE